MKLARARMTTPGGNGAGAGAFVTPIALVALVGAGAWCAWAWTRPVAPGGEIEGVSVPGVPTLALERPGVDDRADRLAALNTDNPFDAERSFWTRQAEIEVAQDDGDAMNEPIDPDILEIPPTIDFTDDVLGPNDVVLTDEDALPDDVKKARDNLDLRGLYTDPAGTPVAMVGYKQGAKRGSTTSRRPGDVFIDGANDDAPWVIARIDTEKARVVLVRSGATIGIELYPDAEGVVRTVPVRTVRTTAETPTLRERTREEIVDELRAQGVAEEDIRLAVALMTGEAIDMTAATPEADPLEDPAIEEAPAGLDAILQFMQQGNEALRDSRENTNDDG